MEIRIAYLRVSRLIHPDRFDRQRQNVEWDQANTMLQAVKEAYRDTLPRISSTPRISTLRRV
jgi:curved DNA-binding protein CbpA